MNILVIGGGGREHALCKAILASPKCSALFCIPGNFGIAQDAECHSIDLNNHALVLEFCHKKKIDLVVIGPEAPLTDGLSDSLEQGGLVVFGPSKKAAQIEGSKGFMKDLCVRANVPTARYKRFTDAGKARAYLHEQPMPIVIKTDGLAAGKGVLICHTLEEALKAVNDLMEEKIFGDAGHEIIIEEFLEGEEISFFALLDGKGGILSFGSAQDHKRVGDGDTGPNTGGMGTYAPAPFVDAALEKDIIDKAIRPIDQTMRADGIPYKGVLFAGLMATENGIKVLEYNVRFGDPEAQAILPRLKSDFVDIVIECARDGLPPARKTEWEDGFRLCVVMAAKGYPGPYKNETQINGLNESLHQDDVTIYHAATKHDGQNVLANGGRVLGVCAWGETIRAAQKRAYDVVTQIDWPDGFFRRDIGWRAIAYENLLKNRREENSA